MGHLKKGLAAVAASLIAAVLVLTLGTAHAIAADKNRQVPIKADDYLPSATATKAKPWNGCRLYGDLGYLVQKQVTEDSEGPIKFDVSTALDAATYGFGTGCDVQLSHKWVIGGFTDISWTNKDKQFSIPTPAGTIVGDADIDHMITVGARFGYLFSPKWMGYTLAGYTWVDSRSLSQFGWGNGPVSVTDAFGDRSGWTIGLGTEAFVGEHWTVGLEYRFTRLDDGSLQWAQPPSAIADVDTDIHRVIVRGAYHF